MSFKLYYPNSLILCSLNLYNVMIDISNYENFMQNRSEVVLKVSAVLLSLINLIKPVQWRQPSIRVKTTVILDFELHSFVFKSGGRQHKHIEKKTCLSLCTEV